MTSLRTSGLRALLAVAALALATAPARGDDSVGVVVTGEAMMQPQMTAQLETWLRMHGYELVQTALPPDAVSGLIDCFVIEDQSCARTVVEKRATADTIVFAQVKVSTAEGSPDRAVTLTAHWLDRSTTTRSERRSCERCTEATMRKTADELMVALTGDDELRGRVKLGSRPAGAMVTIGGESVGKTPLAHKLPPGEHELAFELAGKGSHKRTVTVEAGQTVSLNVSFEPTGSMPLRQKLGYAGLVTGAVAVIGGGILFSLDEDVEDLNPDGPQEPTYFNSAPVGIALMAAGAAALGIGAYLVVVEPKRDSAPTVGLVPGGTVVGWAGRF